MLLGQYDYSIDSKGRMNFPARFRQEMGEVFIVTRWVDDCLIAFSIEQFERVAESVQKGMVESGELERFLFAAAAEVEPDKQGRILIPNKLRKHAGLEKNVTIIGKRNHAEIWDTERWENYDSGMSTGKIADLMKQLGV